MKSPDNNVNQICDEFIERSHKGYKKYGVTTERFDLTTEDWLQHLKEELMDSIVYIHRLQQDVRIAKTLTKIRQESEQGIDNVR